MTGDEGGEVARADDGGVFCEGGKARQLPRRL